MRTGTHTPGTWFDEQSDVGAGPYHAEFRFGPDIWTSGKCGHTHACMHSHSHSHSHPHSHSPALALNFMGTLPSGGQQYSSERTVSEPYNAFHFVATPRAHLPAPIGGVLWFGCDDQVT